MAKKYSRLTLEDRKNIEDGLDRGRSVRRIAATIGRSPSTVMREIRANRTEGKAPSALVPCFMGKECKATGVCGKSCQSPGILCRTCRLADCRSICGTYAEHGACAMLARPPYVCNACRHRRYKCGRAHRYVYDAKVADRMSEARRSDARRGIDMDAERAEHALAIIKDALARGMSPYEISIAYEHEIGVHRTTIYRWVQEGYGDLANLELERKVRFRPRRKDAKRASTSHSPSRSYARFAALDRDVQASAMEMDTVIGRACDTQCILTLFHRPSALQLALLLAQKSCQEVKRALIDLKEVCAKGLFEKLFGCLLTDNGEEFADEAGIASIIGESPSRKGRVRLYYCDPRQSQQKGACEKNHTEIRQILKKGMFAFDGLVPADLSIVMSHANSNPREALCGMSPIQVFLSFFGDEGQALLDALGVRQMGRDELNLKPAIIDIERSRRGEEPLRRAE